MKKFLFAIQIFGLIAILPFWVSFEMSHGTATGSEINTKVNYGENTNTSAVEPGQPVTESLVNSMSYSQLISKPARKCSNENCTCSNCTCGIKCTCNDNKDDGIAKENKTGGLVLSVNQHEQKTERSNYSRPYSVITPAVLCTN